MRNSARVFVAEFIGTFLLVFAGVGAIVQNAYRDGSVGLLGIAAAQGLAFAVGVSATMGISGGHLNPAVTLGLWSVGRIDVKKAGLYLLAQLLAGVVAALAVKSLYPEMAGVASRFGTPGLASDVTMAQGIIVEAILTFLLLFAFMGTAVDSAAPKLAGLGVGLTVFMGIIAAGNITGAAMNPARAFGPALVSGSWTGQAVYWIGPILGGILACQVHERLLMKKDA